MKARHFFLAAVPSLVLATSWPRVAAAQSTLVVVSVRDSTGAAVLPSRIDVLGMSIFALGDSLGRVVLSRVPVGRRTLQVRGIGFEEVWENNGYAGFRNGGAEFILQRFDDDHFAQNFMVRLNVDDLDRWWETVSRKGLDRTYPGVRLTSPTDHPRGVKSI